MAGRQCIWCSTLLLLLGLGACGGDDNPMSSGDDNFTAPLSELSTEVIVTYSQIPSGASVNALVSFSAATDDSVVISYPHGMFLGFRVITSHGVEVMTYPKEVLGDPWEYVVRPGGWDLRVSINVPTIQPQAADAAFRFITWLGEDGLLPPGEYVLEAGLFDREAQYPWGQAEFEVLSAVWVH